MITSEEIEVAKIRLKLLSPRHEHDDCIRIAYEWLVPQRTVNSHGVRAGEIKHLIEVWAMRYISIHDLAVAAEILRTRRATEDGAVSKWAAHPVGPAISRKMVRGCECYNISADLTAPRKQRLEGIGQANTQTLFVKTYDRNDYAFEEP
jgi:hypothetical protein